jgi:hypothetical protein
MQLGASLPIGDIGPGPAVIRDYARAAEGLGFDYLVAPDHVLGANPATAEGDGVGTSATAYHDPQPSPHCAFANKPLNSDAVETARANASMSGSSRCSGMLGINS